MQIAYDYNDNRVHIDDSHSNKEYFCPYCGAPLVTKKGEIRQHHFAHKAGRLCSDTWERNHTYDVSSWHNDWQACFPKDNQEICLSLGDTKHRADVLTGRTVVEFQHSILSPQKFDDRNNFYLNLDYKVVWLFDISDLIESGNISYSETKEGLSFRWKNPKKAFNSYDVKYGNVDLFFQISNNTDSGVIRVIDVSENGFEAFVTSKMLNRTAFLQYVGLENGVCQGPERDDLVTNTSYIEFKEKYGIELNKQQERAMLAINGANLLLAVPGSGKTNVLIARLGYMILEKGINPSEILAITFNKNAAHEMIERFEKIFGENIGKGITFKTINSLSNEIYKSFCKENDIGINGLVSSQDQREILKALYKKHNCDDASEAELLELITAISYAKNMMFKVGEERNLNINRDIQHFNEIYDDYITKMKDDKKMDFDDQLVFAHAILRRENEAKKWKNKFKYICVDEAQDTSKIQHEIIRILSEGNNIFMVGDEDQSIYGFRAAYPKALLNFRADYKNPYILQMERNYRSTAQIVEKAQQFISKNKGRYEKNMISERGNGEAVRLLPVPSIGEQYEKIAEIAKNAKNRTAFLYRDNESAIVLVDLFLRGKIDFILKKPEMNYFGLRIVQDIISYLKIIIDPYDTKAFRQICNRGIIFLKQQQRDYAISFCESGKGTIFDAVDSQMKYLPVEKRGKGKEFRTKLCSLPVGMTTEEAIQHVLENGYRAFLERDNLDTGKVEPLLLLAKQEPNIKGFLGRVGDLEKALKEDIFTKKEANIVLSTIHSSKGQEYDDVYLVDVYDGRFPSSKKNYFNGSKDSADGEQEERRLFYVGMTRAKNRLTFFDVQDKRSTYIEELFPDIRERHQQEERAKLKRQNEKIQKEAEQRRLEWEQEQRDREAKRNEQYQQELEKWRNECERKRVEQVEKERNQTVMCYNEIKDKIDQQEEIVKDSTGRRWVRCEECGCILPEDDFSEYGGKNRINLGTCNKCHSKQREV